MKQIILSLLSILLVTCLLSAKDKNKTPLFFNEKKALVLNGTWDFKYIPSKNIGKDLLFYRKDFDVYVWIDSAWYYDAGAENGVDGIVYSNRTPQADYWQVRKVYSPVQVIEKELLVIPGKQRLNLLIYNQYDFLNLDVLNCKWTLFKNRETYHSDNLRLRCNPHDTIIFELPVDLPKKLENNVWILHLEFWDNGQNGIYEHSINLLTKERLEIVKQKLLPKIGHLNKTEDKLASNDFIFHFSKKDFSVKVENKTNLKDLISTGLHARVGRLGTINDKTIREKQFANTRDYPWNPHLLQAVEVTNIKESFTDRAYKLSGTATFIKGENFPGQRLKGNISCNVENKGIFTVDYNLVPENTTGILLEAGISFKLPKMISDFIWLGDGPFSSYPDRHMLAEFGVHYLKKSDINLKGNRANLEIAVLTDTDGNGIAIIGDCSDISVELIDKQIVDNHNAMLSGNGNKKTIAIPAYQINDEEVKNIKGTIKIIPLKAGRWPEKLVETIGLPDKSKRAFAPFYHCYDWSK